MNPLRWRKMSWLIILWSVGLLIWAIVQSSNETVCDPTDPNFEACRLGEDVGTGIGVALLFFIWFIGFIIFAIIWFMTRPRHRQCPRCGNDVKRGQTACKKCGYDFAAVTSAAPGPAP